jgi:hypothetical protein
VDEAIEWLQSEITRVNRENGWKETEASKHLRTATTCLMALDTIIDDAERFANMHCTCN